MKHLAKLLTAFILSLYTITLQAQTAIPATAGNGAGAGGSVSYTVGQLVFTTSTGSTGSMAQGVQQPYEISVVTEIEQAKDITLICSVYPNPTIDILILKVENLDQERLKYQLMDASGKSLKSNKVNAIETSISMEDLLPSIYFLKVTDGNKEVKTFKIIKK